VTRVSDNWTAAEWRDFELYYAGVLTREAECRDGTPFAASLRSWAENARQRAAAINLSPAQGDLFGGAA